MKILLYAFLTILSLPTWAQSFTPHFSDFPLRQIWKGEIQFADLNGDGYPDIFMKGREDKLSGGYENVIDLYLNDGTGRFPHRQSLFGNHNLHEHFELADLDGDNDLDLILGNAYPESPIKWNDGTGTFTNDNLNVAQAFGSTSLGAIAISDVDRDADLDILITGNTHFPSGDGVKLMLNDGNGTFTESASNNFTNVKNGAATFADVDGDNDPDLFISGERNDSTHTQLYLNDGSGNFTELTNTPFDGVSNGSLECADVDGDNDLDLMIAGLGIIHNSRAKLYLNDGAGSFTLSTGQPFARPIEGDMSFFDMEGDGDPDIVMTGYHEIAPITKIYENDGTGAYTEVLNSTIQGLEFSSIAVGDIDLDNDLDVILTGRNQARTKMTSLFTNDGAGHFEKVRSPDLLTMRDSDIAVADVDNDNDLDIFITGEHPSRDYYISTLWTNDGTGLFLRDDFLPLNRLAHGATAFGDLDNDGDPDLLVTGKDFANNLHTDLYLNDGNGGFTPSGIAPFEKSWKGTLDLVDIDQDNDLDVLITGLDGQSNRISKLYLNNGNLHFTLMNNLGLPGIAESEVEFADFNGDQHLDVVMTGVTDDASTFTHLYLNNGQTQFSITPSQFDQVATGSLAVGDFDHDNDPDVLLAGFGPTYPLTKLYENQGGGNFTVVGETVFKRVARGKIAFTDFNNDTNLDILLYGITYSEGFTIDIHMGNGEGKFGEMKGTYFDGKSYGVVSTNDVAIADFNQDMTQDILVVGEFSTGVFFNDGIPTSIEEVPTVAQPQWEFFPNPVFGDEILITHDFPHGQTVQAQVLDLQGRILQTHPLPTERTRLPIGNLSNGVYFIRLQSGKLASTSKLVVQR